MCKSWLSCSMVSERRAWQACSHAECATAHVVHSRDPGVFCDRLKLLASPSPYCVASSRSCACEPDISRGSRLCIFAHNPRVSDAARRSRQHGELFGPRAPEPGVLVGLDQSRFQDEVCSFGAVWPGGQPLLQQSRSHDTPLRIDAFGLGVLLALDRSDLQDAPCPTDGVRLGR